METLGTMKCLRTEALNFESSNEEADQQTQGGAGEI